MEDKLLVYHIHDDSICEDRAKCGLPTVRHYWLLVRVKDEDGTYTQGRYADKVTGKIVYLM